MTATTPPPMTETMTTLEETQTAHGRIALVRRDATNSTSRDGCKTWEPYSWTDFLVMQPFQHGPADTERRARAEYRQAVDRFRELGWLVEAA